MRSSRMMIGRTSAVVDRMPKSTLVGRLAALVGLAMVAAVALLPGPSRLSAQEPPAVGEPESSGTDTTTASSTASLPALDAELSPDGRMIAFRAYSDGEPRLFVRDALDTLAAVRPLTPAGRSVGRYAWAPDSRHVVFTDEGRRALAVVRVDEIALEGARAGGAAEAGGVADAASRPTPTSSELIADADGPLRIAGFASDPMAVLVEVPGSWPDAPDLIRIDLGTGERRVVAQNDGGVRRWIPDGAGAARLAIREDEDGGTELTRRRDGELVPVYRCDAAEICEPVGFHPDGRVWIRSDRGRGMPALLLLDPLTAEEEVVRADVRADPRTAFRDEAAFAEATSRVREAAGEDAALTFHRPGPERARWSVEARGPESAEILVFDRWSGAVERVLALASQPSPSVSATEPDPSALEPVRLAYRITEDGGATPPIEMVRRIERGSEDGSAVWRVVDEAEVPTYATPDVDALDDMDLDALAEDPDAVDELLGDDPSFDPFAEPSAPTGRTDATDTVVLDGSTLTTIRRRAEGVVDIRLDFSAGGVSGVMETEGVETPVEVATRGSVWSDGAGLETLVAALPLVEGYRTRVPVLETETTTVDTVEVMVTGAEEVTTPAGSFDVWRVRLGSSAHPDREETWLVRRGSPHHLVRAEVRMDDLVRITELTEMGGPS